MLPGYYLILFVVSFLQYTLAMVGYGDDEMKTTVLELTYNYGVTEYTKGTGYARYILVDRPHCDIFLTGDTVFLIVLCYYRLP